MNTLSNLEEAIANRKPVSFTYLRVGKTDGERIGNPHAVFIKRLKSGEERVYAHIWQTAGATDSGQELPSWRQFFLNDLHSVVIRGDDPPFDAAEGYNPAYYDYPIRKI